MGSRFHWQFLIPVVVTFIKQGLLQNHITLISSTDTVLENGTIALTCSKTSGTMMESQWTTSMYESKIGTCVLWNNVCREANFLLDNTLYECICNNNGTYTVMLKQVDRSQHGVTWRCGENRIESNAVIINVSVPVTHAILTQSSNEPPYENTSIMFTCTSSYSLPSAQIRWYRSYRPSTVEITDSRDVFIKRQTQTREDNVIRVIQTLSYMVNRSVNGWSVHCTATNWQNNIVTSAKTRLSVIYPPDRPPVINGFTNESTYKVMENEKVNLSCSVMGGNPLARPEWQCNRIDNITSKERITNNETVISYLSWIAKRTDGNSCTCTTSHVLSNVSTNVSIDILYRASVKMFVVHGKSNEYDVPVVRNESNFITFSCEIDSNPNSTVKIITPNGTEIIFTGTNMIEYSHFLSSCMDNGTYTCSGSNDYNYGHPGVAELSVFVKCTQMAFTHTKTEIRSKLYDPVLLQFKAVAYPDPEFTWEKWAYGSWQQLTNDKQFYISSNKLQSNLTVSNFTTTTTTDVYRLLVVNEIGKFIQTYTIKPFGPPGTPKEFRNIEEFLTDSSMTLSWKPGLNGGISQTFVIVYTDEKVHTLKNIVIQDIGNTEMNVTVGGLSSDTRYMIQLIAVNTEGSSGSVTLQIQTKGYSEGKQASSPVIGIVTGVLSLVVLAIVIAAFVLLYRRYKKKTDRSNEERSYDNVTEMTTVSGGKSPVVNASVYEQLRPGTERGDDKIMEKAYDTLKPEQGPARATSQPYANLKL